MDERRFKKRTLFLLAYLVFAILPVYWMINMSFKTNEEILSTFSLWPQQFTWDHYKTIFTDESWYSGYINSMIYVAINTVISLLVALPAAPSRARYVHSAIGSHSTATDCATYLPTQCSLLLRQNPSLIWARVLLLLLARRESRSPGNCWQPGSIR